MGNIDQVQLPNGTQYDITPPASNVSYTNTTSKLSAADTQAAIDEVVGDWAKQLATREGATASKAYSSGDWIIDSEGYTGIVLTSVASGATWTQDTNYKRRTIGYHLNHSESLYTVTADGTKTKGQAAQEIISVANALAVAVKRKTILSTGSLVFYNAYASSTTARYVAVDFTGSAAKMITIYGSKWYSLDLLTGTITDESSEILSGNLGLSEL